MRHRLEPSAYADPFARDHLPPLELWPDLELIPELANLPPRVNAAVEILDGAVARHAERVCLRTRAATWTYAKLLARANRIAAVLVDDFGLVPGARVLLRGVNSPMLAACWFGVLKAGGIAVTTMPLLRARELTEIVNRAEVRFAFCEERLVDELAHARPDCPTLEKMCCFHSEASDGLEAAMARKRDEFDAFLPSRDDVALIAFTSGTTGKPKATLHFHRDVLAICHTVPEHVLRSSPDDVFVGGAPLGFTYGLGSLLLFPICRGASTVLLERCTAEILIDVLREMPITTLMIGPTLYRSLLPLLRPGDSACLRMCCSSGEHLPATVSDAWRKQTGLEIRNLLGSTEMLHAFIATPAKDSKSGSLGFALPGYRVEVLDGEMRPARAGVVGRLAIRGPTGCRYLGDEGLQQTYVADGWNLTGDTVLRDGDGALWYHARADDIIVSSGYNISGAEIEGVLLEHPKVSACAVVGIPDPARGMIVKAFIVASEPRDAGSGLARALQEYVKTTLAPYKYPRVIEFVGALPLTPTGKIQRSALRTSVEGN